MKDYITINTSADLVISDKKQSVFPYPNNMVVKLKWSQDSIDKLDLVVNTDTFKYRLPLKQQVPESYRLR